MATIKEHVLYRDTLLMFECINGHFAPNSKIAVIGLNDVNLRLSLIDHSSRPMKIENELWLLYHLY